MRRLLRLLRLPRPPMCVAPPPRAPLPPLIRALRRTLFARSHRRSPLRSKLSPSPPRAPVPTPAGGGSFVYSGEAASGSLPATTASRAADRRSTQGAAARRKLALDAQMPAGSAELPFERSRAFRAQQEALSRLRLASPEGSRAHSPPRAKTAAPQHAPAPPIAALRPPPLALLVSQPRQHSPLLPRAQLEPAPAKGSPQPSGLEVRAGRPAHHAADCCVLLR